jgi:hypothetical protein
MRSRVYPKFGIEVNNGNRGPLLTSKCTEKRLDTLTIGKEPMEVDGMKKAAFYSLAVFLLASVALAQQGPGGLGAGGPGGFPRMGPGVSGFVTSVGQDSIKVKPFGGDEVTISVSSETTCVRARVLRPSDLKAGDQVRAMGRATEEGGPIEAFTVVVGTGGFPGPGRGAGAPGGGPGRGFGGFGMVSGKVKSASQQSIVVETDSGDRTVRLTENTRIEATETISLSGIKTGDWVTAMGGTAEAGTPARMIRVSTPPDNIPVFGVISSKGDNWVELQPRFQQTKTKVTLATDARILKAEKLEADALKVGDKVTIMGRAAQDQSDQVVANAILLGEQLPSGGLLGGGPGPMFGGAAPRARAGGAPGEGQPTPPGAGQARVRSRTLTGEVASVSPLSVKVGDQTTTIRVTGQTSIIKLVKGAADSIKTDEAAIAIGKPDPSGALAARVIVVGLTPSDLGRLGLGPRGGASGPGGGGPPSPPGM